MSNPTETESANLGYPQSVVVTDTKALDQTLAEYAALTLQEAIIQRGSASLVVSGGRTPLGFLRCLAALGDTRDSVLPWAKIRVVLADERWVAVTYRDSNEGMLRRVLPEEALQGLVSLRGELDEAAAQVAWVNEQLAEQAPFDLVILGMGADGHTASLFPEAPQLISGLDLHTAAACLLVDPPAAPHQRISLTLARLLKAQQVIVHITGEEKSQILAKAWQARDPLLYPISSVLRQNVTPVAVFSDRALAWRD